jgi:CRP-like cAMP-binding protein
MLLVEKVLALKSSSIFGNLPEQELIDIANIMEEIELEKGDVIFEKGDFGDCLYIIKSGAVHIHDQQHRFATLNDGEMFGELSLLDAEPRSASATAASVCWLLKLKQEPFIEVLMQNSIVLKGILSTLSRRLRDEDKKAVEFAKKQSGNT